MIDKKQILWGITDEEDKFLMSRMYDLAQRAEKTGRIMYSRFLNPGQKMLVKERFAQYDTVSFFGGFKDADRCIAAFIPSQWEEPEYPVTLLKLVPSSRKTYSHRDYLGSVLAMGIDRELTGDIIVTDYGAYMPVMEEISDFIMMNLSRIANSPVKITVEYDNSCIEGVKRFKESSVTVSSLRLDCVLSSVTGKSRSVSASLIDEGLVSVNYDIIKSTSFQVKNADVISLRGYGKFITETDGTLTKKGRIHLNIKKYV